MVWMMAIMLMLTTDHRPGGVQTISYCLFEQTTSQPPLNNTKPLAEVGRVRHSIGLRPDARVLGVIGLLIGNRSNTATVKCILQHHHFSQVQLVLLQLCFCINVSQDYANLHSQ